MIMISHRKKILVLRVLSLLVILISLGINYIVPAATAAPKVRRQGGGPAVEQDEKNPYQKKMCMPSDKTVRAKRKTCLLRPDNGPCRGDIVSWYYNAKLQKCYRFLWGGCQGNGNRFIGLQECLDYCYVNISMEVDHLPYFCSLAFDFGTCFGQYNRWGWDTLYKDCRRRLYSGCGGNQNNFETRQECLATCLLKPNNTMNRFSSYTTCIPFTIADMQ